MTNTQKAIDIAVKYGGIDGEHHKTWVIDQIVRILAGKNYKQIVKDVKNEGYTWDEGIAP